MRLGTTEDESSGYFSEGLLDSEAAAQLIDVPTAERRSLAPSEPTDSEDDESASYGGPKATDSLSTTSGSRNGARCVRSSAASRRWWRYG